MWPMDVVPLPFWKLFSPSILRWSMVCAVSSIHQPSFSYKIFLELWRRRDTKQKFLDWATSIMTIVPRQTSGFQLSLAYIMFANRSACQTGQDIEFHECDKLVSKIEVLRLNTHSIRLTARTTEDQKTIWSRKPNWFEKKKEKKVCFQLVLSMQDIILKSLLTQSNTWTWQAYCFVNQCQHIIAIGPLPQHQ